MYKRIFKGEETPMSNLMDYLSWRGDLTFAASPFCEVDNIILAMLSFIDYSGIVSESFVAMPVKLSKCFEENRVKYPNGEDFGNVIPEGINDLFRIAANSVRFSDVYVSAYRCVISEKECVQFAAVTFILPDNTIYISYRGTDDSLVGWKEDFALSYKYPVMSQVLAAEYINEAASVYRGNIRTGGHSKGGNLAVYAAAFARPEVCRRIIVAYSNDGPGFIEDVINSEEFRTVEKRICAFVPQSSVIGTLLSRGSNYNVIESNVKNGLLQHNPFTWEVMGREFVHLPALSPRGKRNDEVFREWLGKLDTSKRREFTDILFGALESTGAKTVSDLSVDHLPKLVATVRALSEIDREGKDIMLEFIRGLFEAMRKQGAAE